MSSTSTSTTANNGATLHKSASLSMLTAEQSVKSLQPCVQSLRFHGENTGHFVWRIAEKNTIHQILYATTSEMFQSPPFEMANLQWVLQLYPNGANTATKGSVLIRLRLLSQTSIDQIQLVCCILDHQTLSCSTFEACIVNECGWISRVLLLSEWMNLSTHSLCPAELVISVSIKIIKLIFNNNANTNQQKEQNLMLLQLGLNRSEYVSKSQPLCPRKKITFVYKLSAQMIDVLAHSYYGKRFESSIFDNMWRLVIYPRHWSKDRKHQMYIGLHLCAAPVFAQGVTAKYTIVCMELSHKKWKKTVDFTYKSPTSGSGKFVALKEIQQFECVSFQVTVETLKVIMDEDEQDDEEEQKGVEKDMISIVEPNQISLVLSTVGGSNHAESASHSALKTEIDFLRKQMEQKDDTIRELKDGYKALQSQFVQQRQIIRQLCEQVTVLQKTMGTQKTLKTQHEKSAKQQPESSSVVMVDQLLKDMDTS